MFKNSKIVGQVFYAPLYCFSKVAAEMLCHLCVPASDIPFRSDTILPIEPALSPAEFAEIAPALVTNFNQFLLACSTQTSTNQDRLAASTVSHVTHCLLLALSRCSIEALPSLSRLTEFLSQQLKLKDAAQLSREIISRIPQKLLQARFQSDDAKEGLTPDNFILALINTWKISDQSRSPVRHFPSVAMFIRAFWLIFIFFCYIYD